MDFEKITRLLHSNDPDNIKIAHELLLHNEELTWKYASKNLPIHDTSFKEREFRIILHKKIGNELIETEGETLLIYTFSNTIIGKLRRYGR